VKPSQTPFKDMVGQSVQPAGALTPKMSVNLWGEKEWNNKYPFVVIIRIPDILDIYRENGLSFLRYIKCKNFILKKFIPYIYLIAKDKNNSNYNYISLKKHIINNIFYPNIYIFGIFSFIKKIYQKLLKSY
jgi:hypothetical protein